MALRMQEAAGPGRKLLTVFILHGEEGSLLTCEMMEVGLVHEIGNEYCFAQLKLQPQQVLC